VHPTARGKPRQINLRREAMGRECQIRVPGICNGDPRTVVLCHLPGAGMGRKHHDLFGAWGCYECHKAVDGRRLTEWPSEMLKLWFYEGIFRTQGILVDEGLIRV